MKVETELGRKCMHLAYRESREMKAMEQFLPKVTSLYLLGRSAESRGCYTHDRRDAEDKVFL